MIYKKIKITVPVKPFTTIENAKTNVLADKNTKNDFDDLMSYAIIKALELAKDGVITDYDSFFNCKQLIYNSVNAKISDEKKRIIKTKGDISLDDYNSDELCNIDRLFYKSGNVENHETTFSSVESESIKDSIEKFIVENLPKKVKNHARIARIYRLCVMGDKHNFKYTQEQISKTLDVSQQLISRYIGYCEKVISDNSQEIRNIITAGNI